MMVNDETLNLIKSFEGCKLRAYRDAVGVPTIGYGHIKGVKMGQTITQDQADQFLREDLKSAEDDVDVIIPCLTANQRGALISFTFNLGAGNLRKLLRNGLDAVPDRIPLFNKARVGGVLKPLKGLTRRREAERALFMKENN